MSEVPMCPLFGTFCRLLQRLVGVNEVGVSDRAVEQPRLFTRLNLPLKKLGLRALRLTVGNP